MVRVSFWLLAVYLLICSALYFLQDRLLFLPRANDPRAVTALTGFSWELEHADARLTGWFIPAPQPRRAPLVLYYGGNAQDVAVTAASRTHLANTLYVNYRGYGSSTGTPSEAALFTDALAVYDAASSALPHNGKVILHGRSLGSGVAVHVAAERPVAALVLITPYDSIANVAAARYWFVPVDYLLHHRFDSAARAGEIEAPALVLTASHDRIVPPQHAEALVARWAGPVETLHVDEANHLTVTSAPATLAHIAAYIGKIGGAGPDGGEE